MLKEKIFKTIDLFAGIGGIRLGFELIGKFETVYANDCEDNCKLTYDKNFNSPFLHVADIKRIDFESIPDFDILLAGFPCQSFSIAGLRKGFEDKKGRGNLFFEIEKILELKRPGAFFLENVRNLEAHDGGSTFETILNSLTSLGYKVKYKVLNSMEYGNIPQNRERIYIVGFYENTNYKKFVFPNKITLNRSIKDLLDPIEKVPDKYYYNNKDYIHKGKPLFNKLKKKIIKEDTTYQWRRTYVRENKNNVFPTLTANMGTGGHNVPLVKQGNIIRKVTPKECLRVQGFPEDFVLPNELADSHLYKQLGNSVSVPVVRRIAFNIYKALL